MRMAITAVIIVCWTSIFSRTVLCSANDSLQPDERRNQLGSPGFIRDSDRPIARTNVIRQFEDRLYVAGLDHCVRSYKLNDKEEIDWTSVKTYRWPAWREERGEILTLDINDAGSRLAIGGVGLREGTVAEFDVANEKLLRADEVVLNTVVALDYGPDGSLVVGSAYGEVACWRPNNEVQVWRKATTNQHYVRDVHVTEAGGVAIHADGELWRFMNDGSSQLVATLGAVDGKVIAGAFTDDGQRLVIGRRRDDLKSELVEYQVSEGKKTFEWKSAERWVVEGVSYGKNQHDFMAYGVYDVLERPDRLEYQSLVVKALGESRSISTQKVADLRIGVAFFADQDVFWYAKRDSGALHRQSEKIGEWHSVNQATLKSQIQWTSDQRGFCWSFGDNRWCFNFDRKQLLNIGELPSLYRHQEKFKVSPDLGYPSAMSIPMNDNSRRPIPLNIARDGEATCSMTFEKDGKNYVAVGHRFGVSLFEFTKTFELQLVRKLIGHQQMVDALAISEDRRLILSLARDGTVCCFTLEPWKYQSEVGASFKLQGDELIIEAIDEGSPIWETGLSVGNRIQRVQFEGKDVSLKEALERLKIVEPGREFKFVSEDLNNVVSTRVLQRPIWKFVSEGDEWVIYRWRDYYYDCSTKGDQLLAWFINPDTESQPIVFNAEQARERFYQPSKLNDLLSLESLRSKRIQIPELIPPVVNLEVEERENDLVVKATMTAEDNALLVGEPEELSIWVGDLRVSRTMSPAVPTTETVTIDKELLRNGKNRLIARAYNQFGVRGDSDFKSIDNEKPKEGSKLWGLVLGIQDYDQAAMSTHQAVDTVVVPDLNWSLNDALGMEAALKSNTSHFDASDVQKLTDHEVTRQRIADELNRIRANCRPDDFLVLSFAGHGHQLEPVSEDDSSSTFLLLTAESNLNSPEEAISTSLPISRRAPQRDDGVAFESMFDELANLPCRKVVIVDACHSGGAVDIVRALTPDFVVGPTVITAAGKNQFAIEVPSKMHGIFTAAILEAAGRRFTTADQNKDQQLSLSELFQFCSARVPEIFKNSEQFMVPEDFVRGQTPEFWSPEGDQGLPIFGAGVSR